MPMQGDENAIIIVEGIHMLNPLIFDDIRDIAVGVYVAPRTRIITVPFLACMLDETQEAKADDDASEAKFWQVSAKDDGKIITFTLSREETSFSFEVERYNEEGMFPGVYSYRVVSGEPLAGDHGEILAKAWVEREKIKSSKN